MKNQQYKCMEYNRCTSISKKGFAHVLPVIALAILVLSMGAALSLSQRTQDNRSRAAESTPLFTVQPSPTIKPEMVRRADVNGDKAVTIVDSLFIQHFVEGKDQTMGAFGDVNQDGKVTAADGTMVGQAVAGNIRLDVESNRRADVNRDGNVNVTDVLFIQRYVEGKDQTLGAIGDVDKDGKVTEADATLVGKAVAGNVQLDAEQNLRADVTRDGQVIITDSLFIARFAKGIDRVIGAYGDVNEDRVVSQEDVDEVARYVHKL